MLTKEQISQSKWYRQSGALLPFNVTIAFEGIATSMKRLSGLILPNAVGAFIKTGQGYTFYNYFDYQVFEPEFKKVLDLHDTDPGFFRLMHEGMSRKVKEMDVCGQEMLKPGVKDPDFAEKYSAFLDASHDFWGYSLFLDGLDPFEGKILDYIFGARKHALNIRQINALTCPDELSHIQKEQKDMLDICQATRNNPVEGKVDGLLKKHAADYWWIQNNFESVRRLGSDYFRDRLNDMLGDPKAVEEVELGLKKFEDARRSKAELVDELDLDQASRARLAFFNWVTNFRDDRKRAAQMCSYYLSQAVERIASITGMGQDRLACAAPMEMLGLLKGDSDIAKEIEKRFGYGYLVIVDANSRLEAVSGPEAVEYHKVFERTVMSSEIRGSTASLGKATGTVKIILSEKDFFKFQEGDVLVASMTRPEYVPIMKQAAAIITDEGGITCHAAIISRELGIPCIIGTQVATRSLKDGDLIEVNANHSIIKHIT